MASLTLKSARRWRHREALRNAIQAVLFLAAGIVVLGLFEALGP
jgi:hypothetical protein